MESTLTPDTQAVLLLCGELGQPRRKDGPNPLGLRQYNILAAWLKASGLRPGDLLTVEGRRGLGEFRSAEFDLDRLAPLLERGAALALMVERWERSGLWVISRSDRYYPERLKRYLGQLAPPLLYGVGSQALLSRVSLAVVGSRDRSEEDGDFARRVGEHCAKQEIAVVSGAAKGIDRDAMSGTLEAGGWALGVLAEGLAKTATSGQYRAGLVSDRLTLVSSYDPDSRWFAYTAMDRNKLLYGLSSAALVVASSADSGGTWTGATEALRQRKVRVFVKSTGVLAAGNSKLIRMGGIPFPAEPWEDFTSLFTAPEERNGDLFFQEVMERAEPQSGKTHVADPATSLEATAVESVPDAYKRVIEDMLVLLKEPQSDAWLAGKMSVRPAQMKDWLDRAVHEGRVTKQKKPIRYVVNAPALFPAERV